MRYGFRKYADMDFRGQLQLLLQPGKVLTDLYEDVDAGYTVVHHLGEYILDCFSLETATVYYIVSTYLEGLLLANIFH